jgi:hypothetical protein
VVSLGNDNIFKNGARVNSGVFPEVSGLERVEVLKVLMQCFLEIQLQEVLLI